jgi:hypothetical protein
VAEACDFVKEAGKMNGLRGFLAVGAGVVGLLWGSVLQAQQGAPVTTHTRTVDASTGPVYLALGSAAGVVMVADPDASAEWDIAFNGTEVMLNRAAGVTATCLCANQDATPDELMEMTPASELAAFQEVNAQNIPADDAAWSGTVFGELRWYWYDITGGHMIWPTYDVYLVRRGNRIHKLQITGYYSESGVPRQVTLRYEPITP